MARRDETRQGTTRRAPRDESRRCQAWPGAALLDMAGMARQGPGGTAGQDKAGVAGRVAARLDEAWHGRRCKTRQVRASRV